ncbi:MAG: hypothetical protein WKF84_02800 [Pyrinomonadaceae bacterium]
MFAVLSDPSIIWQRPLVGSNHFAIIGDFNLSILTVIVPPAGRYTDRQTPVISTRRGNTFYVAEVVSSGSH